MSQAAVDLIADHYHFNDGWVASFEYVYLPNKPPVADIAVQVILEGRSKTEQTWDKVKVVVEEIEELYVKIRGNERHVICCDVKLLKFGDLWCLDIDGCYGDVEDPSSLDEVRQDGDFYIIGKSVTAYIIEKSQAISRDGKA